jgi:hypothetical protein
MIMLFMNFGNYWIIVVLMRIYYYLPFQQRFAGSNPAEDDAFLMAIKIRSRTPSEGK